MKLPVRSRALPVALLAAAAGVAPVTASAAERLTVHAPPALDIALRDIARAFRTRHEGMEVELRFAGTTALRAQPGQDAAADVFISPDTAHAAALQRAGRTGPPARFASGRLVLVTRRGWIVPPAVVDVAQSLLGGSLGAPGGGDAPGGTAGAIPDRGELGRVRTVLRSLTRPGTRVVLADSSADAGRDAARALERMAADPLLGEAFRSAVRANVVGREPGSREALASVARGEADAAFAHATDALRAESPVGVTALPPEYAVEAVYAAAVTADATPRETAVAFAAFLTGDWARSILRRHGFGE